MVGLSRKRVFPKTKGDSITGQDRAQKHCDFRFSQIEKKSKVAVLQLAIRLSRGVKLPHVPAFLQDAVNLKSTSQINFYSLCITFYSQMRAGERNFTPLLRDLFGHPRA